MTDPTTETTNTMTDPTTDGDTPRDDTSNGEGRAQLEAERDFLLRSLDDLEAEHDAGGIDEESYETLRDDYTARAAAVIRTLRDGIDARPSAAPSSWKRRALVIGGVVVFAVGAGVALAAALGARLPGQTATGDSQASKQSSAAPTNAQLIKRLEDAIAKNPNDTQTRMLLAPRLEATGDLAGALTQYDAVVKVDPTNAVAEAQAGRIIYLSAEAAVKSNPDAAAQLVAQSKARLEHAIELDGNYADAYYFHAIVLANEYGDFAGAQNDLQHYLVLAPNGTWVGQAQQLIADVTNAMTPTTTSPPSTTNPSTGKSSGKSKN
jgi:cytochrome c-type biogenesis protein CcmH/NrfG